MSFFFWWIQVYHLVDLRNPLWIWGLLPETKSLVSVHQREHCVCFLQTSAISIDYVVNHQQEEHIDSQHLQYNTKLHYWSEPKLETQSRPSPIPKHSIGWREKDQREGEWEIYFSLFNSSLSIEKSSQIHRSKNQNISIINQTPKNQNLLTKIGTIVR